MTPEASAAQAREVHGETDAEGVVRLPLESAGLWNVRTLQIVPADAGSGADWDAHWATLVFPVGPAATSGAPRRGGPRLLGTPVPGAGAAQSDAPCGGPCGAARRARRAGRGGCAPA